jgi:hypothetical protein
MEPPVSRPWEEWSPSRSLATVPRYSDVSVNIAMYTLYNNIVSDIFLFWYMCGLPGHTYDEPGFVLWKTGCDK